MYKIAAFIEFNKKIENKILKQKKIVKKKFGNQPYLNHPVHLTLFTLNINKISELKKIYLNNLEEKSKSFYVYLNNPGIFYNDPLTKGDTFFYHVKKNKKISELQIKHLKKINQNLKIFKKKTNLFQRRELKINYNKFGFPFVGSIWIPHVTVASIKNLNNKIFVKKFLSSKFKFKSQIKELKFYKIIKDRHEFLFSVKNF